uniref:Reverse transcriptase domain-containing protein n=1 Tax=Tanacetum cinerariifolium TaxID=118510 RepID=A0A6L2P9Y7_TANCI|nr:reverse transcriptase domain-containing protein [Tanacetum cinerariifolium]
MNANRSIGIELPCPASPRNTFSDPSENLTQNLLAALAISPFYDDPYMKVMQAYNAELPIQAPIAPPPSPVLSSQFDSRDFFLPKEIFPPRKRARFLSHSSADLAAPPHIFETEESSHKTHLERHEEHIETILNHLDELPFKRIEEIKDKIRGHDDEVVLARVRISTLEMIIEDIQVRHRLDTRSLLEAIRELKNNKTAPKKTSTSTAPAMTQTAIRKLVADSVATALEAQAANVANAENTNRNTEPIEAPVARKCSYKEFISCQPFNFKGTEGAVRLIRWFEQTESVFSRSNCTEDCKVKFATGTLTEEALSWNWQFYVTPTMVPNSEKMMEVFIEGLPRSIEGNVTASKPQNLEESITITQRLMDQVIKHNYVQGTSDQKRKFDDRRNYNYQNNRNNNNNNSNNDHHQQQNRRQETVMAYAATPTVNSGHYKSQCRKANNSDQGRAYMLRDRNAHQDPNVDTGTFLLNQHLARVLFDSGADKSFVSISLASMLNIPPITINAIYDIEMDDRNLYHAKILCDEKVVHIPIDGETLIIRGDRTQKEAMNEKNVGAENLCGIDKAFEVRPDGTRCVKNRSVIRFRKRGKLNLRYIGPFKIIDRIGPVEYKLELPEELSNVYSTFHVSNLKKCLSDESLVIPMTELQLDDKLNFMEEPVEIMDQ